MACAPHLLSCGMCGGSATLAGGRTLQHPALRLAALPAPTPRLAACSLATMLVSPPCCASRHSTCRLHLPSLLLAWQPRLVAGSCLVQPLPPTMALPWPAGARLQQQGRRCKAALPHSGRWPDECGRCIAGNAGIMRAAALRPAPAPAPDQRPVAVPLVALPARLLPAIGTLTQRPAGGADHCCAANGPGSARCWQLLPPLSCRLGWALASFLPCGQQQL
jgi:hypothetical protein